LPGLTYAGRLGELITTAGAWLKREAPAAAAADPFAGAVASSSWRESGTREKLTGSFWGKSRLPV